MGGDRLTRVKVYGADTFEAHPHMKILRKQSYCEHLPVIKNMKNKIREKKTLLKSCVHYIFASFLQVYKGALVKQGKTFFISLGRLFLFLRLSTSNFSDIQKSWRHQMVKHETSNIFYWITWKFNTVWCWNVASLCHIAKGKFLSKNFTKTVTGKLVPNLF